MQDKQHANGFKTLVSKVREQIKELTVDEAYQDLLGDKAHNWTVIDVRETNEVEETGVIPRAIHISRGILECDIEKKVPDLNTPIILYCGGGSRSALSAINLQQMGYQQVYSMYGGFRGWYNAGYPLEGAAPDVS